MPPITLSITQHMEKEPIFAATEKKTIESEKLMPIPRLDIEVKRLETKAEKAYAPNRNILFSLLIPSAKPRQSAMISPHVWDPKRIAISITRTAAILAGETPFISIKESPARTTAADTMRQVVSVIGSALYFNLFRLQCAALKKKNDAPRARMDSPTVSAYAPATSAFLMFITIPVDSTDKRETSIGR